MAAEKTLQHFYGKWQFDGETESSILCTEINREQRTIEILKIDNDGTFWLCTGNLNQLHDSYSQRLSKSNLTVFTQTLLKALNQYLPREYSYGKDSDICLDKQVLIVRMRHEGGLTIDLVRLEFVQMDRRSMGSTLQRILSGFAQDAKQNSDTAKEIERDLASKKLDLASAQQQLQSQCDDKIGTTKLLLARFSLVLDKKKQYIRELEAEVAALKKGGEATSRNQRSSIVSSQSEDMDEIEPAAVKMPDTSSVINTSKLSYISQPMSVDQRKQGNEAAVTSLSSLLQTDRDAPSTGAVTSVRKKIKLNNPSEALTTTTSTTSTSTTSAYHPTTTSTSSSQSSMAALPRRTTRTSSNSGMSADFMLRQAEE